MNVRELVDYLSRQNPEALVVERIPGSHDYVELSAAQEAIKCGLRQSTARYYRKDVGRIPCVVLEVDNWRHES